MTRYQRIVRSVYCMITLLALLLSVAPAAWGQTGAEITPTDSYYLARSIDDALVSMYGLTGAFTRKPISANLRPRNVFEKTVDTVERFNVLHPNAISQAKLDGLVNDVDIARAKPADVYALLNLMKAYLVTQGVFQESTDSKTEKTPGDVFYMLRQIAWREAQIAQQKNLSVKWGTPAQVYDAVVTTILPAVYGMAADAKISYEPYAFPKQAVSHVQPRNIYKLLRQIYAHIAAYYAAKGNYDPLQIEDVSDCDEVTAADVVDLTQVIASELKANLGGKTLAPELAARYAEWQKTHEQVEPGHTFRLLQHLFMLTKHIGENTGK